MEYSGCNASEAPARLHEGATRSPVGNASESAARRAWLLAPLILPLRDPRGAGAFCRFATAFGDRSFPALGALNLIPTGAWGWGLCPALPCCSAPALPGVTKAPPRVQVQRPATAPATGQG